MEEKIYEARPGQSIYDFLDQLEDMRLQGIFVTAKFNGVTFTTSEKISSSVAYEEAKKINFRRHEEGKGERSKEALKKMEKQLKDMLKLSEKNEGKLTEQQIMNGLGKAAYDAFELEDEDKLDSQLCQDLIIVLQNSGYSMCPKEKAYRSGKGPTRNEVEYVIDQSWICAAKDNLPNDDNYIKYAIETAMTQLNDNTLYGAMYSFFYIYNERHINENKKHNEDRDDRD